ncbi:putative glycoside hydrolase [Roseibacillus persicicus]|uniref:Uncharacterized protein n=1 Tax=Roseibacillus persicicus TaxID=454148 RepID=A0A918WFM9_9BACT|nr:putative glycoside hydrolase [Roseibacillus persicicus]GHC46844.1 hypothetical protein GCM10007100_10660 [Roseibacillus persicicus]
MRITTLLAALFWGLTNGLLTAESSLGEDVPLNWPAFSWDTVPLYMHVRKDTAYTQDEIDYLATFPLLTFEKSNGHRDSGSTEEGTLKAARAVKAVNPETRILYYRNVIVEYGGYAASQSLKGISKPFLVGENGKKNLIRNRLPAYDLSNKAVRDWWVDSAEGVCADSSIDGLFLDGVVKVVEQGYLRREIGPEKKLRLLSGYTRLVKETREMLGPNKMMVANILRARFPDSGASYLRMLDGSYIEGFEGSVGKMSREDYVAKGMEAFQKAAREGSLIAFTCRLGENLQDADEAPEMAGGANKLVDENHRANYLLAMFLVCAEEHSYFCLHDGYDAKTSKLWLKRRPEFERPLGPPQGPATRDGYRFSRDFAHASVRLDVESEEAKIIWKQPAGK